MEFFDKNGHCADPSILGELIQDPDKKIIVQILEAAEEFFEKRERQPDLFDDMEEDFEDEIPF